MMTTLNEIQYSPTERHRIVKKERVLTRDRTAARDIALLARARVALGLRSGHAEQPPPAGPGSDLSRSV
jgi:hypothetical protein